MHEFLNLLTRDPIDVKVANSLRGLRSRKFLPATGDGDDFCDVWLVGGGPAELVQLREESVQEDGDAGLNELEDYLAVDYKGSLLPVFASDGKCRIWAELRFLCVLADLGLSYLLRVSCMVRATSSSTLDVSFWSSSGEGLIVPRGWVGGAGRLQVDEHGYIGAGGIKVSESCSKGAGSMTKSESGDSCSWRSINSANRNTGSASGCGDKAVLLAT